MKQFFKFFFASCLGTFVTLIALGLIGMGLINSAVKSASKKDKVNVNSVLSIKLNEAVPERTNNTPIDPWSFETDEITGMADMLKAIQRAKDDDNIKGIYIESPMPQMNFASISAVRAAILDFKESGKFVVAYADYMSETGYYLSSVADKVIVNPVGGVDYNGFVAQVPYFKGMLDKIGVKYEIFKVGKFKSATEPYSENQMSEENRKQLRVYINDIYNNYLADLSKSRKITVAELRRLADNLSIQTVDDAVKYGLIDTTGYRDNVNDELRKRLGLTKKQKVKSVSLAKYTQLTRPKQNYKQKQKVAVVYAEGTILMGTKEAGSIGGENYASIIRKLRKDKNVKAIVLRVNSPGGSMIASEKIWRELSLAKEAGMPIVVSMGDYAASGGYYIACMADTILAEANTLTGSIGVFSMFPNAQKLMNEKLGVRMDTVKTNEYALGINPIVGLSEKESKALQATTEKYYDIFIQRVANGRNMNKDSVMAIAEGRIWTGTRAKKLGLVDEIGNLDKAIEIAASMADLNDYRLAEYPKVKDPIEQYIQQFTGNKVSAKNAIIRNELGDLYPYYAQLKTMQELEGVQARMLYDIKLD